MAYQRNFKDEVLTAKPKNLSNLTATLGKVPPNFKELEEAVIGNCLVNNSLLNTVKEFIKSPDYFYQNAHKSIWEAVLSLQKNNKPVDLMTIITELRKLGTMDMAGGVGYITSLINFNQTEEVVVEYAMQVAEAFFKRYIISSCNEYSNEAFDLGKDVFETLQNMAKWHVDLLDAIQKKDNCINTNDLSFGMKYMINQAKNSDYSFIKTGIQIPYQPLEVIFPTGLKGGKLICVAGRPGMGKTTWALDLAIKTSETDKVGFISLEMTVGEKINPKNKKEVSIGELQSKIFANKAQINFSEYEANLLRGKRENRPLTDYYSSEQINKLEAAADFMAESKIELDYLPNLDINSLRNMIMRFVIKHNCKMVILDYLQLVSTSKNMNKTDGIGEITQMLKGLSIQFDIPIIILAQLNREVEKRSGDHKPLLSDLKDSGSIEADCDIVLFPYRPEYYEIKEDMNGQLLTDQTIIIVAKHRGGKLGEGTIFHNLWCSRYYSTYEQMIEGRGKFGKSLIPLANEPDPFYSAGLSEFGI